MRKFLRFIIKLILFVSISLWACTRFHFSDGELFVFAVGFYIVIIVCESMPSVLRQEKLQRLGNAQGIYSDVYVERLLKVAKKEDKAGRVPLYISLIAVYLGRSEFEKAENVICALPIDWPKQFTYKLLSKELMRMRAAVYFNNAVDCYYYMGNSEKADYYYNAGKEYIEDYLENGQNRILKSSIKETLACYAELHGDDDRALQLLDEMENTNNLENFCSGTILRARIYIKRGNNEEARALLENIAGKSEQPLLNRKAEEMLKGL